MEPGRKPVLFVIGILNHNGLNGMLINNSAYSAYPSEGELILSEGERVMILGIEKDVMIENVHKQMLKFDGWSITVVYLFN